MWPGEFHGQRSLADYSPRGLKESDTTERLSLWGYLGTSLRSLFHAAACPGPVEGDALGCSLRQECPFNSPTRRKGGEGLHGLTSLVRSKLRASGGLQEAHPEEDVKLPAPYMTSIPLSPLHTPQDTFNKNQCLWRWVHWVLWGKFWAWFHNWKH